MGRRGDIGRDRTLLQGRESRILAGVTGMMVTCYGNDDDWLGFLVGVDGVVVASFSPGT